MDFLWSFLNWNLKNSQFFRVNLGYHFKIIYSSHSEKLYRRAMDEMFRTLDAKGTCYNVLIFNHFMITEFKPLSNIYGVTFSLK